MGNCDFKDKKQNGENEQGKNPKINKTRKGYKKSFHIFIRNR